MRQTFVHHKKSTRNVSFHLHQWGRVVTGGARVVVVAVVVAVVVVAG